MAPANMAMLILGWCSLLYGVTELINSIKFHTDKKKFKEAQEIQVAEEVVENTEELTAEEVKDEAPDDKNLPYAPTSSDKL